jgi:DNA polymerase-3 subunit chi
VTSIDFYTHCADRLEVAARLVVKAWAQHGSVRVLTPGDDGTAELDARLWRLPPTGFLPHCRLASPLAAETPIVVDHALVHEGPAAVLINLHPSPPPFFSRFERLVEIVGTDDGDTAAGRERWRFYKERGYALRSHNLAQRE